MGKGGGVSTGGVQNQVNLMNHLAAIGEFMGQENFNLGRDIWSKYGSPTYDALLQMSGFAPGQTGQYTDPTASKFMQPVLQAGQQAATAAKKNLFNQNLGPGMQAAGAQQIDLARMANAQTGALNLQQWVAQQLEQAGGTGISLRTQAPSTILGAGSLAGQAGGLEMQLANMQMQAQQGNNLGLASIFKTIGTIGGLALGGPMGGQIGGAIGGAFGGGGGAPSYDTGGYGSTTAFGNQIMSGYF